jgi:hypothetical protein
MKASFLKPTFILSLVILTLGFIAVGCKKETPPPQEPTAKEKEFLSAPDAVTCELEKTTISKLDLPEHHIISFIRRMERENREDIKEGRINLANRPYKILLGERPKSEFSLFDVEKGFSPNWWGSWSLHSYQKINDKFFEFMLIENGKKIAARPYQGLLGTIKAGKGNRELEKVEFQGSLRQKDSVSVPVGTTEERWPKAVAECTIPVGDYTPYIIRVTYDNLNISISDNYHTNAQGLPSHQNTVYGMQIREDKPYVLDFSNKPMVIFDQPSMDQTTFSRGDEINFAAVLIDPKLDIMIRGLDDTSVQVEKETSNGHKYKRHKSLDPNVVIARADGEVIAEGVMPFG